jgi:predicted nucleic acid-binding protein
VILDTNALSAFIDGEPAIGVRLSTEGHATVDVTGATTVTYARLCVSLRKLGHAIPANDTWIAALALQHRRPIMSRDEHFDAVPGLRRETW